MTGLLLVISAFVALDMLALRFGADSRRFDQQAGAWW